MKNPKIFGVVLVVIGFAILILNAADYLGGFFGFSWEIHLPSSAVGIIFLGLGMYQLRLYEGIKTVKSKK